MKKLVFVSFIGAGLVWRVVAQTGDTQRVAVQLTATHAMYDRVAILNYIQNQEFEEAITYVAPILRADSGNEALLGYAEESVYYYASRAWTKLGQYRTSDSLLQIALKIAISPTAE
jgi:hypothetical protein